MTYELLSYIVFLKLHTYSHEICAIC